MDCTRRKAYNLVFVLKGLLAHVARKLGKLLLHMLAAAKVSPFADVFVEILFTHGTLEAGRMVVFLLHCHHLLCDVLSACRAARHEEGNEVFATVNIVVAVEDSAVAWEGHMAEAALQACLMVHFVFHTHNSLIFLKDVVAAPTAFFARAGLKARLAVRFVLEVKVTPVLELCVARLATKVLWVIMLSKRLHLCGRYWNSGRVRKKGCRKNKEKKQGGHKGKERNRRVEKRRVSLSFSLARSRPLSLYLYISISISYIFVIFIFSLLHKISTPPKKFRF